MTGGPYDADGAGFDAFERAGWERQAPTYDTFLGRITRRLVGPMLDAAGVGPGRRVLDVATGPGYAAAEAAARGASVVGVDVATAMLEVATRLHPDLRFEEADAEALPFEDGAFDAVVGGFVVPHLGRPERAVSELARVLGAGGSLALTTWDSPERMRLLGVVLDAVTAAGATAPESLPTGPPFFRYADQDAFAGLLRTAGLTDVEVTTVGFDHDVASAHELWDGIMSGTVRSSALIELQDESTQRRIRDALEGLVEPYRRGDRLALPVSVAMARGRKP